MQSNPDITPLFVDYNLSGCIEIMYKKVFVHILLSVLIKGDALSGFDNDSNEVKNS
jgi:hypothetical protein